MGDGHEIKLETDELAKILWEYSELHHKLRKADAILVLGSQDTRNAEYAADLYLKGYAPMVIISGGLGKITNGFFARPEAEVFSDIILRRGVPEEKIVVEN